MLASYAPYLTAVNSENLFPVGDARLVHQQTFRGGILQSSRRPKEQHWYFSNREFNDAQSGPDRHEWLTKELGCTEGRGETHNPNEMTGVSRSPQSHTWTASFGHYNRS
jgi:hypothetical protein